MAQDYILRLIEQAGVALKRALQMVLGREASREDIEAQLGQALSMSGLDLQVLRACDGATLMQMAAPAGDTEHGRCWLLAETLYVDGLDAELGGRADDASESFGKARMLFGLLGATVLTPGIPEATDRIVDIDQRLAQRVDSEIP